MAGPGLSVQRLRRELLVTRASNDLVFGANGEAYIDLFTGNGTVLLGHGNAAVQRAVREQLDEIWSAGALRTPSRLRATAAVERFFPEGYRLAGLYSTGMEVAEFALRVARTLTRRRGVIGFAGGMHGKSVATASLGWRHDLVTLPDFHRLPYVPAEDEEQILAAVAERLRTETIGAVVIEPLQGSSGGHLASRAFFEELSRECARHGTLLVVDEIFTGFHRTGDAFLHQTLGLTPDIVLVGKSMGSGFPVSGAVVLARHPIDDEMLPGSTFAGNPLASAAVAATLAELERCDVRSKVAAIEAIVTAELAPLAAAGIPLRGKGALWVLELPRQILDAALAKIFERGVLVSPTGSYIRLLPAATISIEHLVAACRVVREACLDAL